MFNKRSDIGRLPEAASTDSTPPPAGALYPKPPVTCLQPDECTYRALFEACAEGMVLFEDSCLVEANPAAVEVFGYTQRSDLIGHSMQTLSPGYQSDGLRSETAFAQRVAQVRRCGGQRFEWLFRGGHGNEFWVEISLAEVAPGQGGVLVATVRDIGQRLQCQREAEAARDALQSILNHTPAGIVFIDEQRRIRQCNQAFLALFGYTAQAIEGRTPQLLYHSREAYIALGREAYPVLRAGGIFKSEHDFRRADGSSVRVSLTGRAVDSYHLSAGFIWVFEDITERYRLEAELRLLARTFESSQAIVIANAERLIERVNPAFTELTGFRAAEVTGQHLEAISRTEVHGTPLELDGRFDRWQGEVWKRSRFGEAFPAWESVSTVRDLQGRIQGYVVIFHDISEQKRLESELQYEATYDRLTGALNRQRFERALEREIQRYRRYRRPLSLLMLDIDYFKSVNDTYGHDVGDSVLRGIARLVRSLLRDADLFGRWGGEEFLVLLPETDVLGAADLAERFRSTCAATEQPPVGAVELSIGVTQLQSEDTMDSLLKRVDDALYSAKNQGRNCVVVA